VDEPVELLRRTLGHLAALLESVTEPESWEPTGCAGWSVLDLGFHLLEDAHRALVDLATPADGLPDTDAVGYWRPGRPSPHDGDDLWSARVAASVQGGIARVARRHREAAAAVVVAAGRLGMQDVVRSQGAVMTVADDLSSMVVEAAIHHLDLVVRLDRPGPSAGALAEVRRILEGLLGGPLPSRWDDVTAARRGTGREPLTAEDRAELGPRAAAFPLFG
jgi:Mycothiol maleylpyruvate isomerase N-terminal domain